MRDGGWPYIRGSSWVEPTAYAGPGDAGSGRDGASQARPAVGFLALERPDGGWPPQGSSTRAQWVTALVALLPPEELGARAHARAIAWLLETTGRESTLTYRLREWLLGNAGLSEQEPPAWPWTPDTSCWVGPTSLAVLALDKEYRRRPPVGDPRTNRFRPRGSCLSRMCREGGWNHGSVRPLGSIVPLIRKPLSMALAGGPVRVSARPRRRRSLAGSQRRFLGECRSADALNWFGGWRHARAHGQLRRGVLSCRWEVATDRTTTHGHVLGLLVRRAEKGRDFFLRAELCPRTSYQHPG